jgi:hypothetical protein
VPVRGMIMRQALCARVFNFSVTPGSASEFLVGSVSIISAVKVAHGGVLSA